MLKLCCNYYKSRVEILNRIKTTHVSMVIFTSFKWGHRFNNACILDWSQMRNVYFVLKRLLSRIKFNIRTLRAIIHDDEVCRLKWHRPQLTTRWIYFWGSFSFALIKWKFTVKQSAHRFLERERAENLTPCSAVVLVSGVVVELGHLGLHHKIQTKQRAWALQFFILWWFHT